MGLARVARLDHLVELREHVLEPLELLGRHVLEALAELAEVRAHDLLAQPLHQLVEPLLGVGVREPVLLELLDLPSRVRRERVEELLVQPGFVPRIERQRPALGLEDLLEALRHLLERTVEVQVLLLVPAGLTQAVPEGVEAREPAPHALAHQPGQRAFEPLAQLCLGRQPLLTDRTRPAVCDQLLQKRPRPRARLRARARARARLRARHL